MNHIRTLLAIRPTTTHWPAPLDALIAHGSLHIEAVDSIHAAAACIMVAQPPYHGILIDVESLTTHEFEMLATLKLYITLPLWSLPAPARSRRYQAALHMGVVPWAEVVGELNFSRTRSTSSTPAPMMQTTPGHAPFHTALPDAESPAEVSSNGNPETTNNIPTVIPANDAEISLPADVAARYDEASSPVALTEHEIRALLGAAE